MMKKIDILGTEISHYHHRDEDFISLTDMVKNLENEIALIEKWLRNKNTIEFLGIQEEMYNPAFNSPEFNVKDTEITISSINNEDYIPLTDMLKAKDRDFFSIWERIYNPDFNYGEYTIIRSHAGSNNYKISVNEWAVRTNAIGIMAKASRYGGTYAHKDIAFEFGMWISPEFKIYLIKEFQRLKEQEQKQLGWDIKRNLVKINYKIHTDTIKENLIPNEITERQINCIYASETDILNVALFGRTAKEWKNSNDKPGNIRDYANVAQLVRLSNLENLNALFINNGLSHKKALRARLYLPNKKILYFSDN